MDISWKPYDYHPENKQASLEELFRAGVKNQIAPTALCAIAKDIGTVSAHNAEIGTQLFASILETAPDCIDAWSGLAQGLRLTGKIGQAIAAAKSGLKLDPDRPDLLVVLGKLYYELRQYDDAVIHLEKAMLKSPKTAYLPLCETLLKMGETEAAGKVLGEHTLRSGPTTASLAMQSLLAMKTGNWKGLDRILDFTRIQTSDQMQVFGQETLQNINREIAAAVHDHPALVYEPGSTATAYGKQTFLNQLLNEDLARFVIEMIRGQVERYLEDMPENSLFPPLPETFDLTSWVVVLEQSGFQHAHIHPSGWLSGVYYISTPDDAEDPDAPGAIEFGRPDPDMPNQNASKTMMIHPQEGQMLLFPSYFYHGTIPKKNTTPRICISFDIQ